jgi:hypothetical protein
LKEYWEIIFQSLFYQPGSHKMKNDGIMFSQFESKLIYPVLSFFSSGLGVLHRLKHQEYIENVESGIKTNPRIFFKFADIYLFISDQRIYI